MSELSQGAPDLDTRLSEIDRRLQEIQAELLPEREPRPSRSPAGAEPVAGGVEEGPTAEPAQKPTAEPAQEPPRGRSGPLETLLQRSAPGLARRREDPPQPAPAGPMDQLAALTGLHVKLLSSMKDLLEAYQFVLTRTPAPDPVAGGQGSSELSLSAGPFASTEAVRAFERTLAGIPGVREVVLRGYEAGDRVIFDVQLSERTA